MSTPVEIDTRLAELHGQYVAHRSEAARLRSHAAQTIEWSPNNTDLAEKLLDKADAAEAQAAQVAAEMAPLEAQYTGWTRAFVVPEGHVHSSMRCSTCRPTTEFGWVTELSGATEAEIIEAAGSRACTVCYPNAPVDAPAGRIFHATEQAAEQARQERAAKKAAADAKKAANAFGPYRTAGKWGEKLDTVYKAKAFLTDGCEWGWDHPSYSSEDRDAVAGLLAAKLGTTPEEQLEAAQKRAANRG